MCKIKKVTKTEAFRKAGVGVKFLDNLKSGSAPSVEKVQNLAQYFGITTSELLGEASFHVSESDTISCADRQLLNTYHQATPDIQRAVLRVLGLEEKNHCKLSDEAM